MREILEMTEIELADNEHLFTSESVTEGHPDKMRPDSTASSTRSSRRTPTAGSLARRLVNTGLVVVSGEISTKAYVDIQKIVRKTIDKIGYNHGEFGFDCS